MCNRHSFAVTPERRALTGGYGAEELPLTAALVALYLATEPWFEPEGSYKTECRFCGGQIADHRYTDTYHKPGCEYAAVTAIIEGSATP
jgi:hypothetical protein